MSDIRPFRAFRPAHDKVFHVVCRSADAFTSLGIKKIIESNPYSFLNIIFPDFAEKSKSRAGSPERLRKIKTAFENAKAKKLFSSDPEPSYYIYRQIKKNLSFTGIIGVIHSQEYRNGNIKIHEHTLTDREQKLMNYLDIVEWNAEPVLFFYRSSSSIQQILFEITQHQIPLYDFSGTDEIRHMLWKTEKKSHLQKLRSEFEKISCVYIADGHHRSSSSVLLADKRLKEGVTPEHPSQFYMGIFFDKQELKVYEYNRLLEPTPASDREIIFEKSKNIFIIEKINPPNAPPSDPLIFYVYISSAWYSFTLRKNILKSGDEQLPSAGLWNNYFLKEVCNIHDPKNEKSIHYIPGTSGPEMVQKEVDSGKFAAGFVLSPSSVDEIIRISDSGGVMPPKSTWIEPKLLNGMLIYDFSSKHDPL